MSYHGLPCWYELATPDLAGSGAFYSAVLGWSVADANVPGMTYHLASVAAAQVAGMMTAQPGQPQAWTIYVAVDDLDATLTRAKTATVIVPATEIPGTGRFAMLIDPQGAMFALLEPLPGGTGGAFDQAQPGHGDWQELITPDPAAALTFYGDLFGWTETRAVPMGPDMTYHIIARAGSGHRRHLRPARQAPHWKPYFGVASVNAAMGRVIAAGGTVLHGPDEVPGGAYHPAGPRSAGCGGGPDRASLGQGAPDYPEKGPVFCCDPGHG